VRLPQNILNIECEIESWLREKVENECNCESQAWDRNKEGLGVVEFKCAEDKAEVHARHDDG